MTEQLSHLATTSHRCYVGAGGVTIYNTDRLEEEEDNPVDGQFPDGGLLLLAPEEAVQIAEYVLKHREELKADEAELTAQFEQVSQALLSLFAERWKRNLATLRRRSPAYTPSMVEFEQELRHAYRELVFDQTGAVRQWYEAIGRADRFSLHQVEALFWRYFNHYHRERLLTQSFPTEFIEGEE